MLRACAVLLAAGSVVSAAPGGQPARDPAHTFDIAGSGRIGERFPSEHLTLTDAATGVKVVAMTTSRHVNATFYQTHPQWTPDGRYIVFRSNRAAKDGQGWHAYAVSMETYEIVQVTAGGDGGRLHLGWKENVAWHFRGAQLVRLELGALLADSERGTVKEAAAYERVAATLPEGVRPSGDVGLDANERRMFMASRRGDGGSAIYAIDLENGRLTELQRVSFRANHLQANRWRSGEVMYCWETGGDAPQRTWLLSVDGEGRVTNRPAYREHPDEWVTHEVFAGPDHIMFNVMGHIDRLRARPTGIFSMNIRSGVVRRHGQLGDGGYWHSYATSDLKWAVGDTFDGRLYRLDLESGERTLLTAGHRPNSRGPFGPDAHSHHSISPDGRWVLFNSSLLTRGDLMLVPLHPEGVAPESR